MDQHEHSTSFDQMGLDESTVMAFHLDPSCMFNILAIVNVPKRLDMQLQCMSIKFASLPD